MKDKKTQISASERIAMQAERQNKPMNIAHRMLETMRAIEAPDTRYEFMQENLAASIKRCRDDGTPFMIDTIVCPLYTFGGEVGQFENFATITGVGEDVTNEPRYLAKFQRYLATLAIADRFLQELEPPIQVASRIYFGDAGVLGIDSIKTQLGMPSDDEVRDCLRRAEDSYKRYFEQETERLGITNVKVEFLSITDITPQLQNLPLDLYAMGKVLDVVDTGGGVSLNATKLASYGVDEKIIHAVENTALHYALGRRAEVLDRYRRTDGIVEQTFLEVIGFLASYGYAGQSLAYQERKTDLFVTGDPANSYRNDLYFAFLGKKGKDLAVFTPSSNKITEEGIF